MKIFLALTGLLLSFVGCAPRVPLEVPEAPRGNFPQILRFVASSQIVHPGEKVVLQWDARGAETVILEKAMDPKADIRAAFESLGTFPAHGTLDVTPTSSTTYIVSCGNEIIGCSSASVHIIVK